MHLWNLHQQATTYSQDPATLLGINPRTDSWFAYQVRSAVYTFGSWFEARRNETKEVPVPDTKRKPMMQVSKYSDDELRAMLGIGPMADTAFLADDPAADRKASELQAAFNRGDVDWRTMLGITE